MGYSRWGHKESDMAERARSHALPGLTRQGSRKTPGYIKRTKRGHRGAGQEAMGACLLEKCHRVTCSQEHDGAWDKDNTREPSVGLQLACHFPSGVQDEVSARGRGQGLAAEDLVTWDYWPPHRAPRDPQDQEDGRDL